MFATRRLRTGTLIVNERPLAFQPSGKTVRDTAEQEGHLEVMLSRMTQKRRETFLSLKDSRSTNRAGCGPLLGRSRTNAWAIYQNQLAGPSGEDGYYSATFDTLSRMNNSCRPNALFSWDTRTFSGSLRAVRDIAPDEEITVAYCGDIEIPLNERKAFLASYGFECACPACSAGDVADERCAQILSAYEDLPDPLAACSLVEFEHRYLIQRMEEEGLENLTAYYRAHLNLTAHYRFVRNVEKAMVYQEKLNALSWAHDGWPLFSPTRATMHAEEILEQANPQASLELQRGGYVPSAHQSWHIHEMSRALSSEASDIETEIARLQHLHRRISIQLDIHKSITAPIRRLPLELLSEIFAILFDREVESHGKAYIVIYVISRVCSAWRALVRATPRLWTRIPTRVFSPELEVSLAHFHHVTDHISLSGSLPLCLTHIEPNDDALLESFLVKLGPHLARIGIIDFDGSCAYFAAVGNNLRMPNAFEAGMALSGPLLPGTLDFLGNSPALRQVEHFHGYRYQANYAPDFRFPALPALTWLTLEFRGIISTDAILQLLHTCRDSLQHLSLALYFSHDAYTTGPVALSALSELVVDRGAYTVLAYLSAPELDSLRCMSKIQMHGAVTTMDLYIDPFPLLCSFISRMPRPRKLEELHIGPIMRSANTFASFLDALDDVEELSIAEGMRAGFMSEDALIWLTCTDNSQPHLPGLKRIELNLSPHPRQAHRIGYTLGLMLESRRVSRICATQEVVAMDSVIKFANVY
ncbi:hypothetical protein GGG16DRAFT_117652 [Schizophyllum commune]